MAIRMICNGGDTSLLLKTGQTTQYNGELDDGYYERGVIKSYTIFTTGRYAGTTNITVNAKTDVHSNNCVLDNNTTLMWSRYVSASVGPGNDGKMAWTGAADDIFAYCAAANAAGLAGYDDWRVANLFEVFSLTSFEAADVRPDAVAFPGWGATEHWTSTTNPGNTAEAMIVHFWRGNTWFPNKTVAHYCALVRGG